jgi:O-antigen/teichoic acid export membrane protein
VISIVVIGVSVFNLGLNLLLISKFDIFGAAFSFLFTQVLYFGLIYYFAQKYYFVPYEKWKLALMIFLSIIILSTGLLFFTDITWINLVIKVGLLGIFPVVLYFFNFYEKVELQKIRALVFGSR